MHPVENDFKMAGNHRENKPVSGEGIVAIEINSSGNRARNSRLISQILGMEELNNLNESETEINLEIDVGEAAGNGDASETVDITKPADSEEVPEKLLRLPISRIKKLMKTDPDVTLASREAVFLITKATELLLDSLAKEAYIYTAGENKKTVMKKHLDAAINNVDALAFLEGTLD